MTIRFHPYCPKRHMGDASEYQEGPHEKIVSFYGTVTKLLIFARSLATQVAKCSIFLRVALQEGFIFSGRARRELFAISTNDEPANPALSRLTVSWLHQTSYIQRLKVGRRHLLLAYGPMLLHTSHKTILASPDFGGYPCAHMARSAFLIVWDSKRVMEETCPIGPLFQSRRFISFMIDRNFSRSCSFQPAH